MRKNSKKSLNGRAILSDWSWREASDEEHLADFPKLGDRLAAVGLSVMLIPSFAICYNTSAMWNRSEEKDKTTDDEFAAHRGRPRRERAFC